MKKLITIVIVLVAIGAGVGAYYYKKGGPEPSVTTMQVTRGDIIDQVGATGTLQAVTTVQVGTQVSGTVSQLNADFNSIVHKGQVIARLDPALMQTQMATSQANLARAEADLQRLQVGLQDAKQKLDQARALSAKSLISATDLQNAEVAYKSADAQLKSQQAQVQQAKTSVENSQVNLDHTIITAPIDGIVISRNVDVGQTVAASMQAPTLFIIAADLTKMQVNANIDESDVGQMRPGQVVRFRVDAYPTDTFIGTVQQVRLNPVVVQNVVTYSTVIDVPNPDLRLKPGMTANLNIEVARRSNVLRVPNAATRFRPTRDMFAALNQAVTPDIERALGGGRGGRGRGNGINAENGAAGASPASAAGSGAQDRSAAFQRGGGDNSAAGGSGRGSFANLTPEERQKRMQERMAQMTPEERAQFQQRMQQRMAQGGNGAPSGGAPGESTQKSAAATALASGKAQTIDSLFGPLPPVETRGRIWLYVDKQLKPVNLRLGISDGTWTEVLTDNGLQPGMEVVTGILLSGAATSGAPGQQGPARNPLMGPQRGGFRGR
jgi:HlyD family secretion protein